MAGNGGHHEYKNSKQETGQTVLTIKKALTKTTNCTFRVKKSGGERPKFFQAHSAGSLPPTFKFVPAPLNILHSQAWNVGSFFGVFFLLFYYTVVSLYYVLPALFSSSSR